MSYDDTIPPLVLAVFYGLGAMAALYIITKPLEDIRDALRDIRDTIREYLEERDT